MRGGGVMSVRCAYQMQQSVLDITSSVVIIIILHFAERASIIFVAENILIHLLLNHLILSSLGYLPVTLSVSIFRIFPVPKYNDLNKSLLRIVIEFILR